MTAPAKPEALGVRPVYPVPFRNARLGLPVSQDIDVQVVRDLNVRCLVRAYYGGHFRASWALFRAGLRGCWLTVHIGVRLRWYRVRGLSAEQIDERFR